MGENPSANAVNKKRNEISKNKDKSQYSIAFFTSLEMKGSREVLNWCINVGLFSVKYECPKCGDDMKLIERTETNDGYEWRCRKQTNKVLHDTCRSVRRGSFASGSKLNICDILRIIRLWFGRCMTEFVMQEVNVTNHVVVDWFKFCREVCLIDLMKGSIRIGGEFTVELVECEVTAITCGKEKFFNSNWVIGGIERGTYRCFFRSIYNRTKEELLSVVSEWILPGSLVISDCWDIYDCLSDENFIQLGIDNSLTFQSPGSNKNDTGTSIEPIWTSVERFLRNNISHVKGEFDSYLGEYLWRKMRFHSMSDSVFKSFLQAVVNIYNPPGKDLTILT